MKIISKLIKREHITNEEIMCIMKQRKSNFKYFSIDSINLKLLISCYKEYGDNDKFYFM